MGDFYNAPVNRTARALHKCTYCAEPINLGDAYVFQKGNYDGSWFESKLHPECWKELSEDGDFEYLPYSNERPKREWRDQ